MSSDQIQAREHFLGIVTTNVNYDHSRSPIGNRTGYIRQIAQAAGLSRRTAILFSPDQIDWTRRRIRALLYRPHGRTGWCEEWCSFPQVIYNRIPTRSEERFSHFIRLAKHCQNQQIPIFNSSFLSKDQVYESLRGKSASRFLPDTKNGVDLDYVRYGLIRYSSMFIKPIGGSLGSGIVRVSKTSDHEWNLEYNSREVYQNLRFADYSDLTKRLVTLVNPKHYVTQQGIQLKTIGKRPVDFRVHLHRGKTGRWEVIGVGAKVGGDRAITTHIHNGGTVRPAVEVFRTWYGAMGEPRLQNFCDATIELATAIQESHPFTLGELGIDLGIDQSERIWMFEANSKPGRAVFNHPGIRASGNLSAKKVIEFADYLLANPERGVHRL